MVVVEEAKSNAGREGSTASLNDVQRMMSLILTVDPMLTWLHARVLLLEDDDSLRERVLGRERTEGDDFLIEVKREMLLMVLMSV